MKPVTKEELIEFTGLAKLLSEKTSEYWRRTTIAGFADFTARAIRHKFDRICGEEMKSIREQIKD